jgi:hypothetical protein
MLEHHSCLIFIGGAGADESRILMRAGAEAPSKYQLSNFSL